MSIDPWACLIVGSLATWRFSLMLVVDYGPGDVFQALRVKAGVYILGDDGRPETFFGKLLECVWCTSVWVAVGVFLILLTPLWPVLIPFALSAAAILMNSLCKK